MSEENNKKMYLSDSAKMTVDAFGVHSEISNTLYDTIKNHKIPEESFTIGLFGSWGSGKSFIINKLKEKIKQENDKNTILLWLDVWKYTGHPLLRNILFDIEKQLIKTKITEYNDGYSKNGKSLKDILYRDESFQSESSLSPKELKAKILAVLKIYKIPFIILGAILLLFLGIQFVPDEYKSCKLFPFIHSILSGFTAFGSFIGISGIFIALLEKPIGDIGKLVFFRNTIKNYTEKANFSPEQFEEILHNILDDPEKKFVLVFDNIDRCEPKLAYETLSTIKTFMDISNCFYIIPCDDEAIKEYLSKGGEEDSFSRQFADEFIDKLFQTYLRIPLIKEVVRDKFIKEQLNTLDISQKLESSEIQVITEILYYAYKGETPRNIKRFINDYVTYVRFAQNANIDLLKNIRLFTIIVTIKQKWNNFENHLIEHPSFFSDFLISEEVENAPKILDNEKTLFKFLQNIKVPHLKECAKESILPFIHFREAEHGFEISEKLRTGNSDIKLNIENIKILNKEFQNNLTQNNASFAQNSFTTWVKILSKNKNSQFHEELSMEFWRNIENSKIDIEALISEMLKADVLEDVINSLNCSNVSTLRESAENILRDFLKKPTTRDIAKSKETFDVHKSTLKIILKTAYPFSQNSIKSVFTNWKIDDEYQNYLLNIISEKEKYDYLPDTALPKILKSIDAQYSKVVELLEYWGHDHLPISIGCKIVESIIAKVKLHTAAFSNLQTLTAQWPEILNDFNFISVIDSKFIDVNNCKSFVTNITALITKIFQFGNPEQKNKAINFWTELAYFADKDIENIIDTSLNTIYNVPIKTDATLLTYLTNNLKYYDGFLKCKMVKKSLFETADIQTKIYQELDKNHFNNFNLLLDLPIDINNVDCLLNVTDKREDITLNRNDLSEYLLNRFITEINTGEIISPIELLTFIKDKFNIDTHKDILADAHNLFVDKYKAEPEEWIDVLVILKNIVKKDKFNSDFLQPSLNYIQDELNKNSDVDMFYDIPKLISVDKQNKEILNICLVIAKKLLEHHQNEKENELGIKLFLSVSEFINSKENESIITQIKSNDNKEKWGEAIINILGENEINIEDETPDDSGNEDKQE